MSQRAARAALLVAAATLGLSALAACTSTTSGSGSHLVISTGSPATSTTTSTTAPSTPPPSSTSAASTTPARKPLKTATVQAGSITYVIQIWADRSDKDCAAHAYGAQVIAFLQTHPCYNGLNRRLGTITFNGRTAGFAVTTISIPTPAGQDPYSNAEAFRKLLLADNTGSITDLLRDGYRLPAGPTAIPANEAFTVLGQDSGLEIWDAWYLDGPTTPNDPALIKAAMDTFLQY